MHQHPCPSCGYCPTCGRKGSPYGTYPWTTAPVPYWQPKPVWINPFQYGTANAATPQPWGGTYTVVN